MKTSPWKNYFCGTDTPMGIKNGTARRAYLNGAATPLVAKPVIQHYHKIQPRYAYDNEPNTLSQEMKANYNEVRNIVLDYIGGDTGLDTVIYTPTTTSAINLLSHIMKQYAPDQMILTTRMEHMANYLPYKESAKIVLVDITPDGEIDMEDYQRKLTKYRGKIKLAAVTGASNITGCIPPFHQMAAMAHENGALFFLDAVQLIQHHPFQMKPHTDISHIDFLSFDGHKCYTGQSGGVLVGNKAFLDKYHPFLYGAGITDFVSEQKIVYRDAPERFEAGYPDFLGILSMGKALCMMKQIGLQKISEYESSLYCHLINRLKKISGLHLYGARENVCTAPFAAFNLEGMPYHTLGEKLGFQYGIAIGSGTLGSNLYVQSLLGLSDSQAYKRFSCGQNYGVVRASIGLYNGYEEIDRLANALCRISKKLE